MPSLLETIIVHLPIVQTEQVGQTNLLRVFLTPPYSLLTRANYITDIMNQILYLLNQLRKQGLDIRCLTEQFVGRVIAICGTPYRAICGTS